MKTLQEQYNLIKEGKGNKDIFMKSARSQFPNIFNNLSSFDTATRVMKQKQIISEVGIGGVVTTVTVNPFINWNEFLSEEAIKAEEKKTTKEVEDIQDHAFDYRDDPKHR